MLFLNKIADLQVLMPEKYVLKIPSLSLEK